MPQTLREGLGRLVLLLVIGVVFALIGVTAARGQHPVEGSLGAVFGVVCALCGAVLLAGGGRKLHLDERGMRVGFGFGRDELWGWDEITGFAVRRVGRLPNVVFWRDAGARTRRGRATRGVLGAVVRRSPDGMLPASRYGGMGPDDLAEYLDTWRRTCRSHSPPP